MIVCLCRVVTDRQVRASVAAGASTVEQVGASCGAGTDCGACRGAIADLIDEHAAGCADCPHLARLGEAGQAA